LCIMYHVLFVICIYIPISCIAFGIKYYSKKCISNTLSSIVTGILIVIKVIYNVNLYINSYLVIIYWKHQKQNNKYTCSYPLVQLYIIGY
jgi:hypothetical protein